MKLSIISQFKIHTKVSLCQNDYANLINLYMPIIGMDSQSLYLLLNNLNSDTIYPFKKLIDSLNLAGLELVERALSKLEGVSLLDVYYHEANGYLFILKKPLEVVEFLQNPALSSFLRSQIGEVEFDKIKLPKLIIRGYKDITRNFDDVF